MQNKEAEKALNNLWSSTTDVMFNVLYSQEQIQEDLKVVLNEFKNLYRTNEQNKQYIDQLETKVKELGKGQHTLMQSRRKWKNKYYKERRRRKEADKSVWQIYDDYQDIGNMYFDLDEKVQDIIKQIQWAVDFTKTNNSIISKTQVECLENVLKILKGEKEKC